MAKAIHWAIDSKSQSLKKSSSVSNKMYDFTVLAPLKRSAMGSGIKHIIVGGGYISQQVLDFIRVCCSTKIWEAYTHNQATGIISLSYSDDIVRDHLGGVLEHLELKLEAVDVKECPNFNCDEDPPSVGRLFIRGPGVVKSYLDPNSTAKLEENEYWIDTENAAYISSTGVIKLLTSQNSRILLNSGEVVDPIKLEGLYGELPIISDIKVQPDVTNNFLTAIVFPNKEYTPKKNNSKILGNILCLK